MPGSDLILSDASPTVSNDEPFSSLVPSPSSRSSPPSGLEHKASEASTSSKDKSPVIIERDSSYYIESKFMVFQVQNCLFRVPSYLFTAESQVFSGMFHLPQSSEDINNTEGSSASNPIILPDEYSKEDFRNLMKALYPLSFNLKLNLSKSEWLSVLKLSTKWYFIRLRETAISELDQMEELTFIDRIKWGRRCRISSWIVKGFKGLVTRDKSITDDEALDIDSDYITTAYKLYRMREDKIKGRWSISYIEDVFGGELQVVRSDEQGYMAPQVEIEFEIRIPSSPQVLAEPLPVPSSPWSSSQNIAPAEEDDWFTTPKSPSASGVKKKVKKRC